MPTRWMLQFTALFLAALGLLATFLPQEIARYLGLDGPAAALLVQAAGGLYLGFAILDWSVRDMAIGGIYNRPVLLGNLLHFTTVGLALFRSTLDGNRTPIFLVLTAIYLLLAAWFGSLLFRAPAPRGGA